jgi:hypothetical protein
MAMNEDSIRKTSHTCPLWKPRALIIPICCRLSTTERAGEALTKQNAGEDRDQDGAYAHEHRRCPRVHQPLGGVEHDVVEPEPGNAAQGDGGQVPPRREPLAADKNQGA